MTPQQIYTMIESVGIPTAYHQFADGTGQQPPFICFFYGNSNDLAADNTNYLHVEQLYIELYTDEKDFALEKQIEDVLNANELVFAKEQTYIDDEHMHETIYTTEVILEV
jgi:hypothetical protein